MKKLPFNRKLTLLTLEPQSGYNEPAEIARAIVWANISDVGATTKFAALQAGQTVSLAVTMWRKEYVLKRISCVSCLCETHENAEEVVPEARIPTHCEVDGTRYKIVETGSAKNDLHIKLLLERG